jgi:hypothetical protein
MARFRILVCRECERLTEVEYLREGTDVTPKWICPVCLGMRTEAHFRSGIRDGLVFVTDERRGEGIMSKASQGSGAG